MHPQPVRADLAFRMQRTRWMGFVELRRLCCPRGHHVREDMLCFEQAAVRCKAREQDGRWCGAMLYVLTMVGPHRGHGSQLFVVEISEAEWTWLREEGPNLTPGQVMQRLGASIPEEAA